MRKIQELITTLVENGIVVEMGYDSQLKAIQYDLNTGMKSHCHLYEIDGKILAYMRYDQIIEVDSYADLLETVFSCLCGRTFLNMSWLSLLEKEGYHIK